MSGKKLSKQQILQAHTFLSEAVRVRRPLPQCSYKKIIAELF